MTQDRGIKIFILSLFFITIYSCAGNSDETYEYEIFNQEDKVKGYAKLKVSYFKNFRSDTLIYFDKNKRRTFKKLKTFEITKLGLFNQGRGYLINTTIDSCYYWGYDTRDDLRVCYKGESKMPLSYNSTEPVYKFVFEELATDGVEYVEMYDEDLVLMFRETKDSPVYIKIVRSKEGLGLN